MLEKATLTHMRTLESLTVLWNPERYTIQRVNRFAAPAPLGGGLSPLQQAAGGSERFTTRLFLDSSMPRMSPTSASGADGRADREGEGADLRGHAARIEGWAEPAEDGSLPPLLLFHWGSFRFRGVLEELTQEWTRFDAQGTPIRGWLDLTLRR